MHFFQILKNYLYSSNLGLVNQSYRFSSIFYKRLPIDFGLRVLTFLPFMIIVSIMAHNGYFKEVADTMLQAGQNFYGYFLVMMVYIPIFILFVVSLFISSIGSILKRTFFKMSLEDNMTVDNMTVLPHNYQQAFINSWKNLWWLTVENFIVIFLMKIVLDLYVMNTLSVSLLTVVQAALVTVATSAIVASIVSLPWLKSRKDNDDDFEEENNTIVASE